MLLQLLHAYLIASMLFHGLLVTGALVKRARWESAIWGVFFMIPTALLWAGA
jgi:hypothetical protein